MPPAASVAGRVFGRQAIAGLEFALLAPLLLVALLGTIDVSNAILTARRLEFVAGAVAKIASTDAVQTTALNILSGTQAWQATTAPFALFPGWTSNVAAQTFGITLSGVNFTATPPGCTTNCAYRGAVVWSVANELGDGRLRGCGAVAAAANTDAASYNTLPSSNFGATSLLVADIAYTFHPYFFGFIIGDVPMMQSAYVSPRIDNGTTLAPDGARGKQVVCK